MSPETPPQSPPPNGKFDPFSSSWLYPKEWNLSDLQDEGDCDVCKETYATSRLRRSVERTQLLSPGSSEGPPEMDGSNHDEGGPDEQLAGEDRAQMMPEIATATLDSYEPFHELRTIPSGWDLS
jgi:hypothetical protein